MASIPKIDRLLSRATGSRDVPGIVAMAANDRFILGAFGRRALADGSR